MYQLLTVINVIFLRAKESLLIVPICLEQRDKEQGQASKIEFMIQLGLGSVGSTQRIPIMYKGIARTQSPTNKNYALELPTFGAIVGVSQTEVQWNGLILEEPPS